MKYTFNPLFLKNTLVTGLFLVSSLSATAFCGFYVAKAGAELFNNKSEVILVRDGLKTVITMSNDFKGDAKDFAMVVPVPVVLQKDQIRIANRNVFAALDAYSAPRLVEYYDPQPCYDNSVMYDVFAPRMSMKNKSAEMATVSEDKYQVKIEAQYTVGEYDIIILSAEQSDGLRRWLTDNGYTIPDKANEVLEPYIKSNMKFFVVKVNLEEMKNMGYDYLRPIQISFNSPKFMLPLRLGMANSQGVQDMIVYAFTRTGRIEATNYRTVKVPTDRNIPLYVKPRFGEFYTDLFGKAYRNEGRNCVFLEYAWNVTPSFGGMKCDPCVGPPPIFSDLAEAGVDWAQGVNDGSANVFFTRLHVRYSRDKFPQDLMFQVTPNTEHFQGRYILTHPAYAQDKTSFKCDEGQVYVENLINRRMRETDELVALTSWDVTPHAQYITEYANYLADEQKKEELIPVLPGSTGGKGNRIYAPSPGRVEGIKSTPLLLIVISGVFLIMLAANLTGVKNRFALLIRK
ncbi:MAG: DUF2330 domain-containing protein [Bacteroidota bacterium]|nr:DUF2330 domain-containing protein [Bacteroidota bacterium]